MEFTKARELEGLEPVSPIGQYYNSSKISLSVLALLELEIPVDDSQARNLLKNVFLPINPRFSSIMVVDKQGYKKWKKVPQVNLEDHINIPEFPADKSPEFYDNCLDEYLSKLSLEQLPQNRPMWEIHIIKYPTTKGAGTVIFKIHHALGDGYSLMGALLSCLQRADDPSMPLTFPSVQKLPINNDHDNDGGAPRSARKESLFRWRLPKMVMDTASDLCSGICKSIFVDDGKTPIRSGDVGVEFRPVTVSTIAFPLDDIRKIKTKLGSTINDVIAGVVFYGTRLYMQELDPKSTSARSTALVLLNTRMFKSYCSVDEMVKPNAKSPWGNHFAYLQIPVPKLATTKNGQLISPDPLKFVKDARKAIQTKRNSSAVYFTAKLLDMLKNIRGPEAAAEYLHQTLWNSSMAMTNLMGPMEKMSLANHPVKGFYFVCSNTNQSLNISILSYMKTLRVAISVERDFIDIDKYKSSLEKAFEEILKAACNI
ncbi:hypothetical protein ACFE04_019287 [Oxalis oulophora]